MPHLRLEYTTNLPAGIASRELFAELHLIMARHGVAIGNCKSRPFPLDCWLAGDGSSDEAFVHLDVAMLEGRDDAARGVIGRELLAELHRAYGPAHPRLQITVEVRDMSKKGYFKHPPGTLPI